VTSTFIPSDPDQTLMSIPALEALLKRDFPQIYANGPLYTILEAGHGKSRLRLAYHESQLRPGGTLSGPAMMTLADLALYVAVLASLGPVTLAVTTNLSINFLNKPKPCALIADCTLIKIGKRLAVGDVRIHSEGEQTLVAHATGTYSLPSR
jgi:uncharacterized protein (TIGR00369 family)